MSSNFQTIEVNVIKEHLNMYKETIMHLFQDELYVSLIYRHYQRFCLALSLYFM